MLSYLHISATARAQQLKVSYAVDLNKIGPWVPSSWTAQDWMNPRLQLVLKKMPIMLKITSLPHKEDSFGDSDYLEFGWEVFSGQAAKEESKSHWPCFCTVHVAFQNIEKFSAVQFLSWIEFMPWSTSSTFPYTFLPPPPVLRYPQSLTDPQLMH